MKRLKMEVSDFLKVWNGDYSEEELVKYDEIEITQHDDGNIAVWGNKNGISVLIEDEQPDKVGLFEELSKYGTIIEE